jgi:hypothetical protein
MIMNHTPEVDFVFRILHPDMRNATLALILIALMKDMTDQDRLE